MRKLIDARKAGAVTLTHDAVPLCLRETGDQAKPEPHDGLASCIALQRAIPVTDLDIDGMECDAIAARIVDELRGRIKSHWPAVEKTCDECRGLMAAQPRGDVGEQSKGGGVRFRETIAAEA